MGEAVHGGHEFCDEKRFIRLGFAMACCSIPRDRAKIPVNRSSFTLGRT